MRENNKTGSEAPPCKKGKKWQLQEQLAFLHSADVKRKSFCNITEDNEGSAYDENDDSLPFDVSEIEQETQTDAAARSSPQPVPPKQVSTKEVLSKNETTLPKKTTFRDKVCFAIEKRSKERDTMIKNLLEKDEETDDITLFFKSIAKTVQKMPPSLQQRAKLETLTLISNIESDMWASRQGTSANNQMFMISSPSSSDASLMSSTSQYSQTQQCGGQTLSTQQYDQSTTIMDPYNMPSGKSPMFTNFMS
ncbi:uncharacterized protein LOC124173219 [Ischnura elegans]|uniref:uncharacterized protein LOC124173219 n=1 Tax=Ischnura elegans TaxID=197161 RepID=UPI001ED89536|nr:uncharacterized protein LOC124173219 [Ischnura elegans]